MNEYTFYIQLNRRNFVEGVTINANSLEEADDKLHEIMNKEFGFGSFKVRSVNYSKE